MKSFRMRFSFLLLLSYSLFSFGQDHIATYDLKKGQVLDILLLTTKPDTKETMKEYREKAFPVATEMGYSPLPGFNIIETTQGNYQPKGLILGTWESLPKREEFLNVIDTRVPNFRQMRKKIWSLFDLTYYEMQEATSFELDFNKVVVATAYWKKADEQSGFDGFMAKWKSIVEKTGGTLKVELVNGYSPYGYYYNPDYLVISQWERKDDFDAFLEESLKMDTSSLKNVNQFILNK